MNQRYTSKDTSINSVRLPKIYNLIHGKVSESDQVLDYGCGKYFHSYGLPDNFSGYDPYNLPTEIADHYDVVICSNVLNVIAEEDVRQDLLQTLKSLASRVYITVYEGDGSGVGKETKADCYQLNRKARAYLPEIKAVFPSVTLKNGLFECR